MADKTTIEWTDATWNIITGCTLVDEGCRHCYAARLAATRLQHHPSRKGLARLNAAGEAKFTGEVRFNDQWLDQPLRWKKARRIFVCAHGDLFHESVPDDWIDKVFAVMALAPQHTFQVLTKRPDRMRMYLDIKLRPDAIIAGADHLGEDAGVWAANYINGWSRPLSNPKDTNPANGTQPRWPLPNVWLGTSVSDQASWNARWPALAQCPAAVRFISAEPLLGRIEMIGGGRLHWLICGGESGPNARPMHPDWARSLRSQCADLDVAFHFKQWGNHAPASVLLPGNHLEEDADTMLSSTKAHAGRLLDGREWNEIPGVQNA